MNAAVLTALVDRWRPETHTFHLRAGEMTPTLQDVSMILGLPIQGEPLCMNTASDRWRAQMDDLIGMAPPPPADPKERTPVGAPFAWIRANFGTCPQGANEDTIKTYTRVYLWYMISRTLSPDSGGKLAHWCWLKALTVLEHPWSWGTAALSYLYRQLDEACRRAGSGGIGGCLLLLSVWSWDHLLVGRPRILNERPWPHYRNNPDREPTWAYLCDNVSEMTSDPKIMYRHYTEELDTLTAEQVDWEPYGTYYHIGAGMADLNPKCLEEARFWRMRCPLICMWLVEYHQPHRVMRQFGLYQECPPQWQDTDHTLHRLDRQRQRKITNWPVHHRGHVTAFQHCLEAIQNAGHVDIVPRDLAAFNDYLQWFHQSTRIELVNPAYDEDILDDPIEFDEVAQSQHDMYARKGRSTSIASELNFVRSKIQKTAEECEVIWDQSHRDEKPIGPLRYFIKNTTRKMRRLANLLGCPDAKLRLHPLPKRRRGGRFLTTPF
ncbi:serine/threonine-protein phosphatase 7 long form homolog isoform X2 [Lolium perenne]|uniref:serine/threonine-protein phosphatase 7 long form homolog isoform X2 n=1 Tax=Lolium perenne TaxID=4522 RepID=UPI0021F50E58|nr:serine/threonine-protein phosphatase 7 long form homolog isoform X2 [Lolium perenne]